jgi:hypothetical protein
MCEVRQMIRDIAFFSVLGLPLVLIGGIFVFIMVLSTALIPTLNRKGLAKIPMRYHFWLARITILFGLVHGVLAAGAFMGF